jgi:hypothetical protein
MALHKATTNEIGVPTSYFRIAHIEENYMNPEPHLIVYVYGYADETFRESEKIISDKDVQKCNFRDRYELEVDDTKGYGRAALYARLKNEIPMFEGAEDV